MLNNKVVTMDESGEMAGFAEFLAGIFAKYADDVKLEDLPDPDAFLAQKEIKRQCRVYIREVQKLLNEKDNNSIEYTFA